MPYRRSGGGIYEDRSGCFGRHVPGGAGGVNGFKLVGMTLGVLVHSRAFGYTMGAYGAGMSLYSNFVARGQEVIFPKDTAMEVALAGPERERIFSGENGYRCATLRKLTPIVRFSKELSGYSLPEDCAPTWRFLEVEASVDKKG